MGYWVVRIVLNASSTKLSLDWRSVKTPKAMYMMIGIIIFLFIEGCGDSGLCFPFSDSFFGHLGVFGADFYSDVVALVFDAREGGGAAADEWVEDEFFGFGEVADDVGG